MYESSPQSIQSSGLSLPFTSLAAVAAKPLLRQNFFDDALSVEPLLLAEAVLAHHHFAKRWAATIAVHGLVFVEVLAVEGVGFPLLFYASSPEVGFALSLN